jgi:hypoxanthine-DNA glycosylase
MPASHRFNKTGRARIQSFAPVGRDDARVLVLGSMPGVASLEATAYYAHPRNAFWPVMISVLTDHAPSYVLLEDWPYQQREALLLTQGIALWDVLAECERPGSLDSAIQASTVKVNNLAGFVAQHALIKCILFNGQAAARLYRKHAATPMDSMLDSQGRQLDLKTMPSTSPAMASLNLQAKYKVWSAALVAALQDENQG